MFVGSFSISLLSDPPEHSTVILFVLYFMHFILNVAVIHLEKQHSLLSVLCFKVLVGYFVVFLL